MKPRLARLEKQLLQINSGPCTFCWGQPLAVLVETLEEDPHDAGFRQAVPLRLRVDADDRLTQDLSCRRCGKAARQVRIITGLTAAALGRDNDVSTPLPPSNAAPHGCAVGSSS